MDLGQCRDLPFLIAQTASQARPGREFPHQLDCACQAADGVHGILRFLEAHGGVGAQLDVRRCAPYAGCLKVRALEDDVGGPGGNRATEPADHAGDSNRTGAVGNHQVAGLQRVLLLVQRDDALPVSRRPDEDRVAH